VSHREASWQARKDRFVEYLGNETQILVHRDVLAVAYRDPSALLASMLKSEQPEVREASSFDVASGDAEYATSFTWAVREDRIVEGALVHGAQCTQRLARPVTRSSR
jgi:hypothetical protein